jgi:hypothetical protein
MSPPMGRPGSAGREDGTALLEFALVLPVLLLLVLGIIDLSRAYNAKQTLTHASREAVRVYTVTEDPLQAQAAFDAAVTSIGEEAALEPLPPGCNPGDPITATASYEFRFIGLYRFVPGVPDAITMHSEAVMRCGG